MKPQRESLAIVTATVKYCPQCATTKPLTDFRRCRGRKHGVAGWCAQCQWEDNQRYVQTPRGRLTRRLSRRRYVERHPEVGVHEGRRQRERLGREGLRRVQRQVDPTKKRARRLVQHAVEAGKIQKPTACTRCHAPKLPRLLHAHHADYTKPFEITWLCARCHGKEHRLEAC